MAKPSQNIHIYSIYRLFPYFFIPNSIQPRHTSLTTETLHLKYIQFPSFKIETKSLLRILKLDFRTPTKKDENTAIIILSDFISGLWYGRSIGLLTDDPNLITFVKNRMAKTKRILSQAYANKLENLFTKEYILHAFCK